MFIPRIFFYLFFYHHMEGLVIAYFCIFCRVVTTGHLKFFLGISILLNQSIVLLFPLIVSLVASVWVDEDIFLLLINLELV